MVGGAGPCALRSSHPRRAGLGDRFGVYRILAAVGTVRNATVLDIFAYAMLPLATIAPFAGLTIVFSTLIAATGLLQVREPLTGRQVGLIALTVAGVTVELGSEPYPHGAFVYKMRRQDGSVSHDYYPVLVRGANKKKKAA